MGSRELTLLKASPYVLFLLASGKLRSSLKALVGSQVAALHHLIRCPDSRFLFSSLLHLHSDFVLTGSPEGHLIKRWLIPLIGQLRLRYPLSWDFLFQPYISQVADHPQPASIVDIVLCDKIFDGFTYE